MEELLPNPSYSNNNNNNNNTSQLQSQNNVNNNNKTLISTESVSYEKALIRPLPTTVYYGLEYPANVQNPDKAIESVGGLSKITKVIKSREKEYLQLKFRPNNPTCKPTFGTKSPTCNVLLRVRPIKPTLSVTSTPPNEYDYDSPKPLLAPNSPSQIQQQQHQNIEDINSNINNEKPKFEASVIALVPTTIKFDGLSDFQYLIKEKNDKNTKKSQYYAQQQNNETEISRDEPMNLIPPLFSRVDFPMNYQFKSNPHAHFDPETKQFLISKQPIRKSVAHSHFSGEIPNKPINLPSQLHINDLMKRTLEIMKSLFEKRPIWLFVVLVDNIQKVGGLLTHVKKLLPTVAFNYVDGPWRKCWVKLGFDPRTHQDTYKYQVIDFRISDQETHFATNSTNNNDRLIASPTQSITQTQNTQSQNTQSQQLNQSPLLTSPKKDNSGNENESIEKENENEKDNETDNEMENKDENESKNKDENELMDTSEDNKNNNNTEEVISTSPIATQSTIPLFSNDQTQKVNPSRKKNLVINTFEFQTSKSDTPQIPASYEGYDYTFKTPPSHYNSLYQICDIEEPKIKAYFQQQEIQNTCLKKTGWFTEASFKEGIEKMKNRYGLTDYKMRYKSSIRRDNSKNNNNGKSAKSKNNNNGSDNSKIYDSQSSEQDTLLTNETIENPREVLEQLEKDNKFLNMKKDIDPFGNPKVVGGFDIDSDFDDSAFRILDDDNDIDEDKIISSVYSLANVSKKQNNIFEDYEDEDEDEDEDESDDESDDDDEEYEEYETDNDLNDDDN